MLRANSGAPVLRSTFRGSGPQSGLGCGHAAQAAGLSKPAEHPRGPPPFPGIATATWPLMSNPVPSSEGRPGGLRTSWGHRGVSPSHQPRVSFAHQSLEWVGCLQFPDTLPLKSASDTQPLGVGSHLLPIKP